ncbi:MAG: alpha/beta hydrolase family protein [Weeksellaceae bacterium]
MKKEHIFYLVLIIVGIIVGRFVYTNPIIRNSITANPLAPEADVAREQDIEVDRLDNQPGSVISNDGEKYYEQSDVKTITDSYYSGRDMLTPKYDVKKYTITYQTLDENERLLTIAAQLYVPVATENLDAPIYVFGSGTTGLDDKCAPSKEVIELANWGNYHAHMLSYAAQGYIVLFPDYEGLNDIGRIHHYFVADLEGKTLLDGARAVYDFMSTYPQQNLSAQRSVFLAGYSQGGHAAYAGSDMHASYAPDVPLKGVIGYGSAMNIRRLLIENPRLAPYLVYAYKDLYGDVFDPKEILNEPWATDLENVILTQCVSDVIAKLPNTQTAIYTPTFRDALENNFVDSFQEVGKYVDTNNTGLRESEIPILVVEGALDTVVSPQTAREYVAAACENGNKVEYLSLADANHYQTRQASFQESLDWMEKMMRGEEINSSCNSI